MRLGLTPAFLVKIVSSVVLIPARSVHKSELVKMKLLTHNMLTSKSMKGVTVGYPLGINVVDIKVTEVDFNPEFISRIIPKLDWSVLWKAADTIGQLDDLPKELSQEYENDNDFLKKVHHVLLEVDIVNGELVCPETGRKFPINNGIPNMLLNEDEV
ncbi:PREDICTED: multifunctional methyltransferase subunit TRM112-like protein [Nicrophorus vespilloides]|uniref:Multifunctional methyltransferase subunit TRM112-like protein n=1 Tax=Nicrophorus vespilloides TaxID=110193 RepID=A0ABM1N0X0_NICVS|nr:PREDICTED: multifunctional methyltransferase subunit TRM112-like protein [Nicrophorus vespilloides]